LNLLCPIKFYIKFPKFFDNNKNVCEKLTKAHLSAILFDVFMMTNEPQVLDNSFAELASGCSIRLACLQRIFSKRTRAKSVRLSVSNA